MAVTTIMLIEYKITGIRMTNGVESNNMLRFYNGKVITMNGGTEAVENEVWTDGAKICYVGPKRDDMPHFKREIDLHGDVIMPGFKNAHTHSAMTFLRSFADDLPLARWLNEKVFPMEDKLTPDDVYIFTKLAILEYISSGITSSFDMYFHLDAYAAAASTAHICPITISVYLREKASGPSRTPLQISSLQAASRLSKSC